MDTGFRGTGLREKAYGTVREGAGGDARSWGTGGVGADAQGKEDKPGRVEVKKNLGWLKDTA